MKVILSIILFGVGVLGALYIALWWGIVEPIIEIGKMIDSDTISFTIIAKEVVKFFLREFVALAWFLAFYFMGAFNIVR